jgi:hypothetical protein
MDKNLSPHHPVQTRSGRMRQMQKNINFSTQSTSVVSLSSYEYNYNNCSSSINAVNIFFTGDVAINNNPTKQYNNEKINLYMRQSSNINQILINEYVFNNLNTDTCSNYFVVNYLFFSKDQNQLKIKTFKQNNFFINTIRNVIRNVNKLDGQQINETLKFDNFTVTLNGKISIRY